jgi:hypothetical protein
LTGALGIDDSEALTSLAIGSTIVLVNQQCLEIREAAFNFAGGMRFSFSGTSQRSRRDFTGSRAITFVLAFDFHLLVIRGRAVASDIETVL